MKRIFIATAIIAALTVSGCKNTKKAQELTIQEQKTALADSVLAEIDRISEKYIDASATGFKVRGFELTEKEKQIKPDYLLEPSRVNEFMTRPQKINALAIYFIEQGVRKIYDMPQEEVKEAIAKLAAELNQPVDFDFLMGDAPTSEKIRREYCAFKEKGDLSYFWQYQNAIILEYDYLLAQNPELFFSKITEEQWRSLYKKRLARVEAIEELAKYDEEMAILNEFIHKNRVTASNEEQALVNQSIECAKQFRIANKEKFIAKRNALLQ